LGILVALKCLAAPEVDRSRSLARLPDSVQLLDRAGDCNDATRTGEPLRDARFGCCEFRGFVGLGGCDRDDEARDFVIPRVTWYPTPMGNRSIETIDERFVAGPLWRIGLPDPRSRGLAFTHLRFGIY